MAACRGQLKLARELGKKTREEAARLSVKDMIATEYQQEAVVEAVAGNRARALQDSDEALKVTNSPNIVLGTAGVLAFVGEDNRALKLADTIAQKRPYDTFVQFVGVPNIKANIAMNHGNAVEAGNLIDGSLVYARVDSGTLALRAMAYLKAKQPSEAVQAFQRVLDLKPFFGIDPLLAFDQLGLARAYAMQGDNVHSRLAYQDFFALWKDADPDVPLLREAKAEYAKLQ